MKVMTSHFYDPSDKQNPLASSSLTIGFGEIGTILANWATVMTEGKANVVLIVSDEVPPTKPLVSGFKGELAATVRTARSCKRSMWASPSGARRSSLGPVGRTGSSGNQLERHVEGRRRFQPAEIADVTVDGRICNPVEAFADIHVDAALLNVVEHEQHAVEGADLHGAGLAGEALSSAIIGVLNVWMHMPILLVLAIVIVIGVIVGLVNALFILFFRIPSLVVTLGTTSVMSGLVQWITNSSTIGGIDNALVMAVVGGRLFGVPYAFYYALAAAIIMWYVFDYTPLGRRLLFVGRGREVARLNGIRRSRASRRLGDVRRLVGLSRYSLCRRARLGRSIFGLEFSSSGICGRLPRRHHDLARPIQSLGRDRRRLLSGDGHYRPDHARHSALGYQRF